MCRVHTMEMMALDSPGKAFTLAHTNYINAFTGGKCVSDCDLIADLQTMILCAKFAQKAHGRNLIGFQMTQFTTRDTFGIHFTKAQLHRRIPFLLRHAYLGNETWPSFDECYRIGDTFFIE